MMASSNTGNWKSCRDKSSEDRTQILILDIARAYFNAKIDEGQHTYIALPPGDPDSGVLCVELRRHMYGTRAAADGWQGSIRARLCRYSASRKASRRHVCSGTRNEA